MKSLHKWRNEPHTSLDLMTCVDWKSRIEIVIDSIRFDLNLALMTIEGYSKTAFITTLRGRKVGFVYLVRESFHQR